MKLTEGNTKTKWQTDTNKKPIKPTPSPLSRSIKGVGCGDKYKNYKIVKRTNKDGNTKYRLLRKWFLFMWLPIFDGVSPMERDSYKAIKRELDSIIKLGEDIKNKEKLGKWEEVLINSDKENVDIK